MTLMRSLRSFLIIFALFALGGCWDRKEPVESSSPKRPIEAVLAEHAPRFIAMEGVVSVGQGELEDHSPCIRIFLKQHDAALERRIPSHLEGYPVIVQVTGEIRAMPGGGP